MEQVIVLGLNKCEHCKALQEGLSKEKVPFKLLDVDLKEHSALADRIESLLKTDRYPIIIIERGEGAVYLYRVETLNEAKESPIAYATKIGCVSTDSMIAIAKKYIK
jgi:glutaredoxin